MKEPKMQNLISKIKAIEERFEGTTEINNLEEEQIPRQF